MRRTISASVGKGSLNHNSRKFTAENVDPERTKFNIEYCNENIKDVYHELFDKALDRYNAKQTRKDRKISNYYEKIEGGKQEKLFHELILQVGNFADMDAQSENGELAAKILDEYYQDFQVRNPYLRVFSAHLHMDEATPHLHIDFVPFTTESNRGLDTKVSLKQALANQGFKGGSRSDTEWNQWVNAEKEQLAKVMEKYDIEWEQKGTHKEHLTVLDYKKEKRLEEVVVLDEQLVEKKNELKSVTKRIDSLTKAEETYTNYAELLYQSPEYQLQEPQAFMTAKSYMNKIVSPLIEKIKEITLELAVKYYEMKDKYYDVLGDNRILARENDSLKMKNKELDKENDELYDHLADYRLLRKVMGKSAVDDLVTQCHEKKSKKREIRER